MRVLEFTSDGLMSVNISIVDDSELESQEVFYANISTTDDYVNIIQDSTQIFIQDNGKNCPSMYKMLLFLTSCIPDEGLSIALSQNFYPGQESSNEVEVCVVALSPTSQLSSSVSATVSTQDRTAVGRYNNNNTT